MLSRSYNSRELIKQPYLSTQLAACKKLSGSRNSPLSESFLQAEIHPFPSLKTFKPPHHNSSGKCKEPEVFFDEQEKLLNLTNPTVHWGLLLWTSIPLGKKARQTESFILNISLKNSTVTNLLSNYSNRLVRLTNETTFSA